MTTSPPTAPAVSVLIACFNDGATLPEAVESAVAQDVSPEVIVIDDGSTDAHTLRVFDELERDGVTVVHQANAGLADARMTGVRASRGRYVMPLDADDRLRPGALATLSQTLDRRPDLAFAWGDYQVFGDLDYRQRTADALDPWQITYQNDLPVCSMIRRDALLAVGGWRLAGGYEDWDLWMSFAERGLAGERVPFVAYEYRVHGTRMAGEATQRHAQKLDELRARHAGLFARREELRRASPLPRSLKAALPAIDALPLGANAKRLLWGASCHLAQRRGLRLLVRRVRAGR